jgi:hypothetical protein
MFYGTRECRNMSSYKQEKHYNAELLYEGMNVISAVGIKNSKQLKNKM